LHPRPQRSTAPKSRQGDLLASSRPTSQSVAGIMALQFAKALGARAIITSSSDAKLERARKMGADLTTNYAEDPDWDRRVSAMTDGYGADLVKLSPDL
jgi:Zn-dependent alcohol dehydrogenase